MFSGRGFKAVRGSQIMGFAFLTLRRQSGYVFNVNVNLPFRRQGVGQLLMDHLEQVTRERQRAWTVLQVDEPNLPARRLYEKIGYRPYHPDLFRHQKPALMPDDMATGISIRPLSGLQGQRLFKKYQAAEQEAGDSWAANAVSEYSLVPSDVRYWRCLVQGQEIGCAWISLPSRHHMVAGLALQSEFWGHFAVLKLLHLLLNEARPQPQRFDVYLASSQHHQMARPLLESIGFVPALQARILSIKALA
jgi:N-acetylglutamate synthase-like GNAT family acetyltransferase